jgi:Arc/MetJ-type ribon-helix-helix transcriptional regulator
MSTLSVPLPAYLENFVETMVRRGLAPNKAEVVRRALDNYAEDQAVAAVLKAEQEIKEGKALRGDIRKLMKQLS